MALTAQSLLLYNFQITDDNKSLDFANAVAGPEIQATLLLGFYSLSSLLVEIKRAMEQADPANTYTATADRTFVSGTENRVSVDTDGVALELLFGTGTRVGTSINALIGFAAIDRTGSTSYQGTVTAGIALVPAEIGYSFLPPENWKKVFGSVNISASGVKETVVFDIQKFWQVEFKYEPQSRIVPDWEPWWDWVIQQKLFDFTPETTSPAVFFEGTLERTAGESRGLGYKMSEMLPNYPFHYTTGLLLFRVNTT